MPNPVLEIKAPTGPIHSQLACSWLPVLSAWCRVGLKRYFLVIFGWMPGRQAGRKNCGRVWVGVSHSVCQYDRFWKINGKLWEKSMLDFKKFVHQNFYVIYLKWRGCRERGREERENENISSLYSESLPQMPTTAKTGLACSQDLRTQSRSFT